MTKPMAIGCYKCVVTGYWQAEPAAVDAVLGQVPEPDTASFFIPLLLVLGGMYGMRRSA